MPIDPLGNARRGQALRLTQDVTNRQVAIRLREAADEAQAMAQRYAEARNISGATRAAQLRTIGQEQRALSDQLWRQVGDDTQRGMFASSDLAAHHGADIDRLVGMPVDHIPGYRQALLADSRQATNAMLARQQHGYTLSDRVFRNGRRGAEAATRVVERGLAQGLSAREMASQVRGFYDPSVPGGQSFAAKRLARTEINNSYLDVQRNQAQTKPWMEWMQWNLSVSHPEPDDCDSLAEGGDHLRERGYYRPQDVPDRPHPQCLCYVVNVTVDPKEFERQLLNGGYDDWLRGQGLDPMGAQSFYELPVPDQLSSLVNQSRAQGMSWQKIADQALSKGLVDKANPARMKRIAAKQTPTKPTTTTAARPSAPGPKPAPLKPSSAVRTRPRPPQPAAPTPTAAAAPTATSTSSALPATRYSAEKARRIGKARLKLPAKKKLPQADLDKIHDAVGDMAGRFPKQFDTLTNMQVGPLRQGVNGQYTGGRYDIRVSHEIFTAAGKRAKTSGARSGWTVKGNADAAGTFRHEFGHHVDTMLGGNMTAEKEIAQAVAESLGSKGPHIYNNLEGVLRTPSLRKAATNDVSEYATTNGRELFAELFAEWTGPSPSPVANAFGEALKRWL